MTQRYSLKPRCTPWPHRRLGVAPTGNRGDFAMRQSRSRRLLSGGSCVSGSHSRLLYAILGGLTRLLPVHGAKALVPAARLHVARVDGACLAHADTPSILRASASEMPACSPDFISLPSLSLLRSARAPSSSARARLAARRTMSSAPSEAASASITSTILRSSFTSARASRISVSSWTSMMVMAG
ncbi:MAG: hypothetical protein OXU61_11580, partial [Gammaproteobacteria bacterium]|nr:hypothetical protein [Gammaproteobacteria bacterium]